MDLDGYLDERLRPHADRYTGLVAGIRVGDGQATLGFGRTHAEGPAPDHRTGFQIGSVTKVFTALLLADAVHRGEVELDQPLASILPAVASHPRGRPITLVDLATHTSGLPRLPSGLQRQALRNREDPYAAFSTDDLLAALQRPPARPPGGRSRYSNYGAGVLGHALAEIGGASFEELVASRIAGPFALQATGVAAADLSPPAAVGHTRRGRPTPDWSLPALAGAGALRSTVDDLLAFLAAHLDPGSGPLAAPVELVLPPRAPAGRHLEVALGWHVLDRKGRPPLWWHNGGTGGFFSFVAFDPAVPAAVVVLTNSARSVDRLGMLLLDPLGR